MKHIAPVFNNKTRVSRFFSEYQTLPGVKKRLLYLEFFLLEPYAFLIKVFFYL